MKAAQRVPTGQIEWAEIFLISTANRYLLDLSDKVRSGGKGYGLIRREVDPQELRRNMYSLSPNGRDVVRKLTASPTRKPKEA